MRIHSNPQKLCYEVYCDTDSEYNVMSELSKDRTTVEPKQTMKLFLNSMYGKVVTDMNKDYIVAHECTTDETPAVVIIFKSHICKVRRHGDGTADIFLDGSVCYTADKYEDIIKQLI